jgi:hypothetical protein
LCAGLFPDERRVKHGLRCGIAASSLAFVASGETPDHFR